MEKLRYTFVNRAICQHLSIDCVALSRCRRMPCRTWSQRDIPEKSPCRKSRPQGHEWSSPISRTPRRSGESAESPRAAQVVGATTREEWCPRSRSGSSYRSASPHWSVNSYVERRGWPLTLAYPARYIDPCTTYRAVQCKRKRPIANQ